MIRWAFLVCLASFGLLGSTGQRIGRNNQYPSKPVRYDASASIANSTSASALVNKTNNRKGGNGPRFPGMRKAWREIRQEIAQLRKSIEPLVTSSNSSSLRLSAKASERQFISMVGDLRFIKAELQYIKHQTHVLWENISDARRDHKRMSRPLWWIANNMTFVQQGMEKTATYIAEFHRSYGSTADNLQIAAEKLNDIPALTTSLQQTSAEFADLKFGYIQGTNKISSEIDVIREMLHLLGQGVHETREFVVSGVAKLDHSIGAGHAYLAANMSDISFQLVNQNMNLATLSANVQEMTQAVYGFSEQKVGIWNMLLQMAQTLNEISTTTSKIDATLAPGLIDLQLRMNDIAHLVHTVISSVSFVQTDVGMIKDKLKNITRLIRKKCTATNGSQEDEDYDDVFPPQSPTPAFITELNGTAFAFPNGYPGIPTLPPLIPLPSLPSLPGIPTSHIIPVTPYPTIPIFPGYPPVPPTHDSDNGLPATHVPDIGSTIPRPMEPVVQPGQPGTVPPLELPWGPYGPGVPIGFANRFTGHCACSCPCPCICPRLDHKTNGYPNPFTNMTWTPKPGGIFDHGIRKDCYCMCTCPCPGPYAIPSGIQPGIPPIAPLPTAPGSSGGGVPSTPHSPWFPQLPGWPSKPHENMLLDMLNELLRGHMLIRQDIERMKVEFKADLEETKQYIIDQISQSFEYILHVIQANHEVIIKLNTDQWSAIQLTYMQLRQSTEKTAMTLEVSYTNFVQFHKEFRELLASNNLSTDRLPGYPPIAEQPPFAPGLQLPELIPSGNNHFLNLASSVVKDASSFQRPGDLKASTPGTQPKNSPNSDANRTDTEVELRNLPTSFEDHPERVPNLSGSRRMRRSRKERSNGGCIIIEDCIGTPGRRSPVLIAPDKTAYFYPMSSDNDDDLEENEKSHRVPKASWGIRNIMASPARRMHTHGVFALHDFFQQHINDQLMSVFQSKSRRKGRSPRRKRRRRVRPHRYLQKPLRPGSHYVPLPVKPSSLISAVGSPQAILINKLPWITSQPFEHVPGKITMPRIDHFPYSMSYVDGRGNSVNININRRNRVVIEEAGPARRAGDGESQNQRRCIGKK